VPFLTRPSIRPSPIELLQLRPRVEPRCTVRVAVQAQAITTCARRRCAHKLRLRSRTS
jgi:NitT/TauT family transport system substrate-binding protein